MQTLNIQFTVELNSLFKLANNPVFNLVLISAHWDTCDEANPPPPNTHNSLHKL